MNYDLFRQRQQHSRLSLWELGDLLGIHPHHLHFSDSSGALVDQPVRILIDLARQLDMHPADLVPELDSLLHNNRDPNGIACDEPDTRADAHTLLAGLTTAATPLTIDELATALDWPLDRTVTALDHAYAQPEAAGPYAVRRVPPDRFTLAPRLDQLTDEQRAGLADVANHHNPLTIAEAQALLAAINLGHTPDYETWREDHLAVEQQLKDRDLIRTINGPHRVNAHPDVLVSLRYRDLDDDPGRYQPQPGESAGTHGSPDQDERPGLADG